MIFDDIIGQENLKGLLSGAALNDKVAHAYVFAGPEGIGKRTLACAFAEVLLCPDIKVSDKGYAVPCRKCTDCMLYTNDSHPDFHYFSTEEDSIKISPIRKFLENINYKPQYAKRKVYIINSAEKMTVQSQNALLKTLEEPPGNSVIILLAANPEMLLETIKSRLIRYDLVRYTRAQIEEAVRVNAAENGNLSEEFIFNFSDGIIGKALEICSNSEFIQTREEAFNIISKLQSGDFRERAGAAGILSESRNQEAILEFMLSYYRDMLIYVRTNDNNRLINRDKKDIILNGSKRISTQGALKCISAVNSSIESLQRNTNVSLLMEILATTLQEEYC